MKELSHAELVIWTVSFFFTGIGIYGLFFWGMSRGLRKSVSNLGDQFKEFRQEINDDAMKLRSELRVVDEKKVDIVLYVKDKEAATLVMSKLQTEERCVAMRDVCTKHVVDRLVDLKKSIDGLTEGQKEVSAIHGTLDMVIKNQEKVISRIDSHVNGHSHKTE
jgi:hypothetical protein